MGSEADIQIGARQSDRQGLQCGATEGLHLVMAHRRAAARTVPLVHVPGFPPALDSLFQADLARAFQMETGYVTSAIALTRTNDAEFELEGLGVTDGSSAVVLAMEMDDLIKPGLGCDWQTRLLRFRNSLADQGSKLFVALATHREADGVLGSLMSLRRRLVLNGVKRYCHVEGIGFLGSIQGATTTKARQKRQPDKPFASVLACRLASTSFFCCGAFRIGG
jgi:hypothetical protein